MNGARDDSSFGDFVSVASVVWLVTDVLLK